MINYDRIYSTIAYLDRLMKEERFHFNDISLKKMENKYIEILQEAENVKKIS